MKNPHPPQQAKHTPRLSSSCQNIPVSYEEKAHSSSPRLHTRLLGHRTIYRRNSLLLLSSPLPPPTQHVAAPAARTHSPQPIALLLPPPLLQSAAAPSTRQRSHRPPSQPSLSLTARGRERRQLPINGSLPAPSRPAPPSGPASDDAHAPLTRRTRDGRPYRADGSSQKCHPHKRRHMALPQRPLWPLPRGRRPVRRAHASSLLRLCARLATHQPHPLLLQHHSPCSRQQHCGWTSPAPGPSKPRHRPRPPGHSRKGPRRELYRTHDPLFEVSAPAPTFASLPRGSRRLDRAVNPQTIYK